MNPPFTWQEPPFRYLVDGRDRSVLAYTLPTNPATEVHLCIFWDKDRDARIIAVLAALFLRDTEALADIVAVREQQGLIEVWCRSPDRASEVRRALTNAADRALYSDRWTADQPHLVPTRGTVVDWEKLLPEEPLYGPAKGYQLGVVAVRS